MILPQRQEPVSESLNEDRSCRFGSPVRCDILNEASLRDVMRYKRYGMIDLERMVIFEVMLYSEYDRLWYIRIPAAPRMHMPRISVILQRIPVMRKHHQASVPFEDYPYSKCISIMYKTRNKRKKLSLIHI